MSEKRADTHAHTTHARTAIRRWTTKSVLLLFRMQFIESLPPRCRCMRGKYRTASEKDEQEAEEEEEKIAIRA